MSDRVFVDTNVLVYAYDSDEPEKRRRTFELLDELAKSSTIVISTQVLQEFYVAVTRKLKNPLKPEIAESALRRLLGYPVIQVAPDAVLSAARNSREHRLSFWDALIMQTAKEGGCSKLLSEDLQDGFQLGGVTVENPYASLDDS